MTYRGKTAGRKSSPVGKPSDSRAGKRRDRNKSQYRIPWIVFDRDRVKDFDEIIKTAGRSGVGAGWSNPCFEIFC